jgi:serine/threonine protein kinase
MYLRDSQWAIKIISRKKRKLNAFVSQDYSDQIKREIAILKKVNHPSIVKLRQVVDAPTSDKIFLVLEYMEGGEIIWEGMPLAQRETLKIFRKLVQVIHYCMLVNIS